MEFTKRKLRSLRVKVAQPIYPIDEKLVAAALKADSDTGEGGFYAQIQNPAPHLIYRYLTELTVAILEKHTDNTIDNLKVLDWGGGKGYVTYFLNNRGAQTTLFETDNYPHTSFWHEFKFDTKTSSGEKLPFKDATFDAVIGFGVLEHVPYDYDALKEVNRVLKDTGLFFCFNLPNKTGYIHKLSWRKGVRYHDRLYSRKEVRMLLKRAGFNLLGKPWFRQLLPKNQYYYPKPRLLERLDLIATNYTPLCYFATSIEFVARKQHTYISIH